MLRDNFRGSKRNVLNEDLLIPEWAKKDESLREKLTEKKKYVKVNPDRLDPIVESLMEVKVRSVRNNQPLSQTVDRSRKEFKSRSSFTTENKLQVDHPMNNAYQTIIEGNSLLTALAFEFQAKGVEPNPREITGLLNSR